MRLHLRGLQGFCFACKLYHFQTLNPIQKSKFNCAMNVNNQRNMNITVWAPKKKTLESKCYDFYDVCNKRNTTYYEDAISRMEE